MCTLFCFSLDRKKEEELDSFLRRQGAHAKKKKPKKPQKEDNSPLGLASSASMSITASLTYVVLPIGATAPTGVASVALRYMDCAVESRLLVILTRRFFLKFFFFEEVSDEEKTRKKRAQKSRQKKSDAPVERQAARHVQREPPDHQGKELEDRLRLLLGRVVLQK